MWFNDPFFITLVTTGITIIVMGFVMKKWPPKHINDLYGYRTKRSKKSLAHWNFAQKLSAKLMINYGLIIMLISVIGLLKLVEPFLSMVLGLITMCLVFVMLFVKVETALKQKFKL